MDCLDLLAVQGSLKTLLNQIPYNYTVEVINRFKILDLIDRVLEELWTEVHNIVQESMTKGIPKKKKFLLYLGRN